MMDYIDPRSDSRTNFRHNGSLYYRLHLLGQLSCRRCGRYHVDYASQVFRRKLTVVTKSLQPKTRLKSVSKTHHFGEFKSVYFANLALISALAAFSCPSCPASHSHNQSSMLLHEGTKHLHSHERMEYSGTSLSSLSTSGHRRMHAGTALPATPI